MEATLKLAGGERVVGVSGETPKDLFAQMAMAYEVFNETACGLCGSANIRPVARQADKYHFFEYHCLEPGCGARLSIGQLQEPQGGLFPVRKLLRNGKPDFRDGELGPHQGWTKYRGEGECRGGAESNPTERPVHGTAPGSPPPVFNGKPQERLKNLLHDVGVKFRSEAEAVVDWCSVGTVTLEQTEEDDAACEEAIKQVKAGIGQWGLGKLLDKVREGMRP